MAPYRQLSCACSRLLEPDGAILLQAITIDDREDIDRVAREPGRAGDLDRQAARSQRLDAALDTVHRGFEQVLLATSDARTRSIAAASDGVSPPSRRITVTAAERSPEGNRLASVSSLTDSEEPGRNDEPSFF